MYNAFKSIKTLGSYKTIHLITNYVYKFRFRYKYIMSGCIKSCYSNGKDSLEDDEVLYIVCVSNFKRCMFEAIDLYRHSITKNMKRFKHVFTFKIPFHV